MEVDTQANLYIGPFSTTPRSAVLGEKHHPACFVADFLNILSGADDTFSQQVSMRMKFCRCLGSFIGDILVLPRSSRA